TAKKEKTMEKSMIERYARFTVRMGANVQKGQTVLISCPIDVAWFGRMCAAEAYLAGARDVVVHYNDQQLTRIRMEGADIEALKEVKPWVLASYMDYYEGDGSMVRIAISAEDPEIYKGVDLDRVDITLRARSIALKPWIELAMANRVQWCIVSVPAVPWAQKVFAGETADAAVEKLWEAIFTATRMDMPDPEAAWRDHAVNARRRIDRLNGMDIDALHLRGENGTDLKVGLADDYLFEGVESVSTGGVSFLANVPSEEVFTAPHKDRVEGIVKSSMPYVYNGNLIEGITARFEKGRAVEVSAEKGGALLDQMMAADEGARHLGEIALVPASSPIRKSGILFYNTLFDENAACHIAFGSGYPTTIKNGSDMPREELDAKGLNESVIHEDIMVGTPEMDIDALLKGGEAVPVFRKGEWVL
ncbi:aminopeptidase, partial [Ruminococcaceae bacterium OttesenSCG-928-D13]|nr:aminopeptidase [Ruminococcaceae bacterium OttesenSCG-928-D13]